MEIVLALLKIVNPIEWIKELHKIPILIRITLLLACISLLFLPEVIFNINLQIIKIISLCTSFICLISIVGGFFQNILDKKKQEQLKLESILKQKEEAEKNLNNYFKQISLCSSQEKRILETFYCSQKTTIAISSTEIERVRVMNSQGLKFISATSHGLEGLAYTTPEGLDIINRYYDTIRDSFFKVLKTISGRQKTLLKEFVYNDEVTPQKCFIASAIKLYNLFKDHQFNDIYLYAPANTLLPSQLYLNYIRQYFKD